MDEGFRRIGDREVAWGWVPGTVAHVPGAARAGRRTPLEALEEVLLPHLRRPPCFIAFSGGRDSSVLLAVAAGVARQHGLPDPVPLTVAYDHVPSTDEAGWQERVVRHLRIAEWTRLSLGAETDLLGPRAVDSLRRHGLLWPPTVHTKGPLFDAARGGSLLTGNGGDELFGPMRATPLARLAAQGPVNAGAVIRRQSAVAAAPRPVRRRWWRARQQVRTGRPWLREHATDELVEALLADAVGEPLSARRAVARVPWRLSWVIGATNLKVMGAVHGVRYDHPLLAPTFVAALAHAMPRLGFPDRSEAMRQVFGDVVPVQVLERRSKAYFNAVAVNEHSRRFATTWTGRGVPQRLVEPERLREAWLRPDPPATSMALLHAAWLGCRDGARSEGTG